MKKFVEIVMEGEWGIWVCDCGWLFSACPKESLKEKIQINNKDKK